MKSNQLHKRLAISILFWMAVFAGPKLMQGQSFSCDSLVIEISEIQTITCFGGNDGVLQASVQGGAEPYQIQWNNGANGSELSGLNDGVYGASVFDANGCYTSGLYLLTEPEPTALDIITVPAECGESNGSFTIQAPEENGPHLFALNDGEFQSEGTFSDLAPAIYVLQIENANGCVEQRFITVNAANSPDVVIDQTAQNLCFQDCDAGLTLISSNEELHYTWYSIDGEGNISQIADEVTELSGLCSGNYFVCAEEVLIGGLPNPVTFWNEDFGSGCNQGQLADGFNGDNGVWNVTETGTNQDFSNAFYVSATEQIGADNCGIGCGGENNRTLHISSVAILWVPADGGALYISDFATNIRAESPVIDCSAYENIELTFDYIENGQGDLDNATLWYFDGNGWSLLDDMDKTACCGGPCDGSNQGSFTGYSVLLPESANNNPNVRIGFNWTNNADSQGSDPSFAVDNITLTGVEDSTGEPFCSGCSDVFEIEEPESMELFLVKFGNSSCFGNDDGSIQVQVVGGLAPHIYQWDHDENSAFAGNLSPGFYTVTATDQNGCTVSETYEISEPDEEWVDFDYADLALDVVFVNSSSDGDFLWDFGDGNQSDQSNPSHTYDEPGDYTVCLTLLSDCGDQTVCQELNIVLTNLNDLGEHPEVQIFPNPAQNVLWIVPPDSRRYTVQIHNASGQLVESVEISATAPVDVSAWEVGMYLYTLSSDTESETFRGKIVVSR